MVMANNYLKAVFWDYPELCDPAAVAEMLKKARKNSDSQTLQWLMARFLERGRVRDTALFFRPKEVQEIMKDLRISGRARKRWERLLQVYGDRG
jgi:hypothetical protein